MERLPNSPDYRKSPLLWDWLPLDSILLSLAAVALYLLGKVKWDETWEGFAYDLRFRFWVPVLFLIGAAYVWMAELPKLNMGKWGKFRPQILLEILLCVAVVQLVRWYDPIRYVDDTGFILRYWDNFQQGCFFCFNASEGPVFGLSSFIYGLLGGLMVLSHLFSPESAMSYLSYAGLFMMGMLSLGILRTVLRRDALVILAWLLFMTCSRSLLLIGNSGMEAPVHVSIVLAALLFYIRKQDKWMWLFLALAAISKLDAVPLILVVSSFWIYENFGQLFPISWKNAKIRLPLLYGLLPILIWILFAKLYFGSPLPQSAFAKVYFHEHSKGSWFPFLEPFYTSPYRAPFLYAMLPLWIAQIGYVAAQKRGGRQMVFGFAFVATLLLYYFYNPGERMLWYYVLPEGLLLLQLGCSLAWAANAFKAIGQLVLTGFLIGLCFLFTWKFNLNELDYTRNFQKQVEEERLRIGEYLGAVVQPQDTLLSGHGLISRKAKGLVVDQTGLNSKLATKIGRDYETLVGQLKPDFIVMHGHSWNVDKLNQFQYAKDTSFFDICLYGMPAWRIFRKTDNWETSQQINFVQENELLGKNLEIFPEGQHFLRFKSEGFSFVRPYCNPYESELAFGILRYDNDYQIRISDRYPVEQERWSKTLWIPKWEGPGTPRVQPISLSLWEHNMPDTLIKEARYISLEFIGLGGGAMVYDPMIITSRRLPAH